MISRNSTKQDKETDAGGRIPVANDQSKPQELQAGKATNNLAQQTIEVSVGELPLQAESEGVSTRYRWNRGRVTAEYIIKLKDEAFKGESPLTADEHREIEAQVWQGLAEVQNPNLQAERDRATGGAEVEGRFVNAKIFGPEAEEKYGTPAFVGMDIVSTVNETFNPENTNSAKLFLENVQCAFRKHHHNATEHVLQVLLAYENPELTKAQLIAEVKDLRERILSGKEDEQLEKRFKDLLSPENRKALGISLSYELGRCQWEINSSVMEEVNGVNFERFARELRFYNSLGEVFGAKYNAVPFMAGALPSKDLDHYHPETMTDNPRYVQLSAAVRSMRDKAGNYPDDYRAFKVSRYQKPNGIFGGFDGYAAVFPERSELIMKGEKNLRIKNTSLVLESFGTSAQGHWGITDQEQYLATHRMADLFTPLLIAVSANAPFAFNLDTGLKDARRDVGWRAGTNSLHFDAALDGTNEGWLEHDYDQLVRAAHRSPVLPPKPEVMKKMEFPAELEEHHHVMHVALEAGKTIWPDVRMTPSVHPDGKISKRVEIRSMSAAKTPQDQEADFAFMFALMQAGPEYIQTKLGIDLSQSVEELEKQYSYQSVSQNRAQASKYALDAYLDWPVSGAGSKQRTAGDIIKEDLLPVARKGLRELSFSEAQIEYYIGTEEQPGIIMRRLNYQLPEEVRDNLHHRIICERNEWLNRFGERFEELDRRFKEYAKARESQEILAEYHFIQEQLELFEQMEAEIKRVGWSPADTSLFMHRLLKLEDPFASPETLCRRLTQLEMDLRFQDREQALKVVLNEDCSFAEHDDMKRYDSLRWFEGVVASFG